MIIKHYSAIEEKINVRSHFVGIILSIVGFFLLLHKAFNSGDIWSILSAFIFSSSMILLYLASTLYHNSKNDKIRFRLKVFDHCAIFLLIAGSYTPFTLLVLEGTVSWVLFGIIWSMAITGIILKLFFTGQYNLLSTIIYVIMGWMVIFFILPIIDNLPTAGLIWLSIGGLFYTIGAANYLFKTIKYTHATFHIFVLLGSFCHFFCIYNYVIL
ncbi:MAG: hemolysin D [Gammaproteobacteria bacterium]|nr:MAG: hemolysin D [Gammaproteobacteria bacterium]